MIILLLTIVLVNIISAEDNGDSRFIDALPDDIKKEFLDKIARRILDEVPEVKSSEAAAISGDILDEKLEEQSDFVKKILREEIESLKTGQRRNSILKILRKINNNDSFSDAASQNFNTSTQNLTKIDEKESKRSNTNRTEVKSQHIDLTLRAGRSKRAEGDDNVNNDTSTENGREKSEKFDGEFESKTKNNGNSKEVQKKENKSNEDIQIRHQQKPKNTSADSISTISENEGTSSTSHIVHNTQRPDDVNITTISETVHRTTNDTSTVSTEIINNLDKKQITNIMHDLDIKKKIEINKNYTGIVTEAIENFKLNRSTKEDTTEIPIRKNDGNSSVNAEKIYKPDLVQEEEKTAISTEVNTINTNALVAKDMMLSHTITASTVITTEASYRSPYPKTIETSHKTDKSTIQKDTTHSSYGNENTNTYTTDRTTTVKINEVGINTRLGENMTIFRTGNRSSNKTDVDDDSKSEVNTDKTEKPDIKLNLLNKQISEPKTIKEIVYNANAALRSLQHNMNDKVDSSATHFGSLQAVKEYQVFEVDVGKPAFVQKNKKSRIEQPQYVPVYNYDPEHAYFNGYNRFGPDADEIDNKREIIAEADLDNGWDEFFENVYPDVPRVPTEVDSNRMSKLNDQAPFKMHKRKVHVPLHMKVRSIRNGFQATTTTLKSPQDFLFQLQKAGLKDTLKAAREILRRNEKNGFHNFPSLRAREDTSEVFWENTGEDDQDYASDHASQIDKVREESNKFMKYSEPMVLSRQRINETVDWNQQAQTVRFNKGKTYDLVYDLLPEYAHQRKDIIVNQLHESRVPLYSLKDFNAISQESINSLAPFERQKYQELRHQLYLIHTYYDGVLNKTEYKQMIATLNRLEKARKKPKKFRKFRFGKKNDETSYRQGGYGIMPATPAVHLSVETVDEKHKYLREGTEKSYILDTVGEIIDKTPEVDMLPIFKTITKQNLTIMRSSDDDLELHLMILRDMVKMDNSGLKNYNWLESTVDIQSALKRLIDLTKQKNSRHYIHPSDLELLKYTESLYRIAKEVAREKEKEAADDRREESRKGYHETGRALPKNHKKIKNPWKLLNRIFENVVYTKKVRSNSNKPMDFETFLFTLQMSLNDFHNVIKQVSIITSYNKQRWYQNIKDLYLKSGGKKEYLELLLHLFSARVFDLIEESAKNGADKDYKMYMKENRVEVDRTAADLMFMLRILAAIKNLRY